VTKVEWIEGNMLVDELGGDFYDEWSDSFLYRRRDGSDLNTTPVTVFNVGNVGAGVRCVTFEIRGKVCNVDLV